MTVMQQTFDQAKAIQRNPVRPERSAAGVKSKGCMHAWSALSNLAYDARYAQDERSFCTQAVAPCRPS